MDIKHNENCFDWGVVFGGSVIALAISLVLAQFGAAVGLADDAPLRGEGSLASWGVVAVGIWVLWVQLLASLAGGYVGGYLRRRDAALTEHENELRDGIHGLAVWAFSTVLVFIALAAVSAMATYTAIQTDTFDAPENLTDAEQNAAVIYAFIAGATALLSAVAAWWAATMGGDHRAKKVDFSRQLSFKR